MAFDNIPLFNHMNSDEVKKPFPGKPPRPMTGQELSMEVLHRVDALLHDVNNFKHAVKHDFEHFINSVGAENTAFKESMQATYNAFATALQNEVNNFEQAIQAQFDSFGTNTEVRFEHFESSINEKMEDFKTAINTAFDTFETTANTKIGEFNAKIAELHTWQGEQAERYDEFVTDINASFAEHKQSVNNALTTHINACKKWEDNVLANIANRHAEQDNVILEAKNYMKNKIQATTRAIFEEKLKDGTIEEITKSVFGDAHRFRGALDSITDLASITDPLTGDYIIYKVNGTMYMYASTGDWIDLGTFVGNTQEVMNARTNKAGVEYASLKDAIHNAVVYYSQVVNGHEALAVTADLQLYSLATDNFTFTNTGEVATFTCTGQGSTYVGMYVDIPASMIDFDLPVHLEFDVNSVKSPIAINVHCVSHAYNDDGSIKATFTVPDVDTQVRQIYTAGTKHVVFNPIKMPVSGRAIECIRFLFCNQVDTDVQCSVTNFTLYNDASSVMVGETIASTLDKMVEYVEKSNNFKNIGNISAKYGVEKWTLWGKPSNCELLADAVNYEFTEDTGNNGICTVYLDRLLDFSRMAYIKLTAKNVTGKLNVTAWGKKANNSNPSMHKLKEITEDGDYIIPLDLQYLCAHKDYDHSIYVLIHNDGANVKAELTGLEIFQYDVENSFIGANLQETLENIEKKFDEVAEEIGNIEPGDNITNNNTTINQTIINPIEMRYLEGKKYDTIITNIGEGVQFLPVPVIPTRTLFIGNSLLLGNGTYGMCATSPDKDYYAHLNNLFEGDELTHTKLSGSDWESCETSRARDQWIIDNLQPNGDAVTGYHTDLVVVQLGDNVNTDEKKATFEHDATHLLHRIRNMFPFARVAWVGAWYTNEALLSQMENACKQSGTIFVDISDLKVKENMAEVGDVVFVSNSPKEQSATNVWVYDLTTETLEDGTQVAKFYLTVGASGKAVVLPIENGMITFSATGSDGEGNLNYVSKYKVVTNEGVASHPGDKGMLAIANRIAYVLGITDDETSITE